MGIHVSQYVLKFNDRNDQETTIEENKSGEE